VSATCWSGVALAEFHTYQIEEIFSNADGTVQYIVMHESQGMGQEYFWAGNRLLSSSAAQNKSFVFPTNLPVMMNCNPYYGCAKALPSPTSTANTRVLIATQGFADQQIVVPDYIVPNGFLSKTGGTINYAGVDQVTYGPLPTDGVTAINRAGALIPNVATNFFGQSGSATSAPVNYQGLWWNDPAGSESGWGINFAHQGDIIFATWFTYDVNGKAWWLTMVANKTAAGVYSGQLARTNGTPFNAYVPPASVTVVGSATVTFTDATHGTFSYTVNDGPNVATQTKSIVLQTFGPVPTCVWGAQADLTQATGNYQDLWWATGGVESGWGVNLTQQGTTIFATWFTYDAHGNPLWLSAVAGQVAPGVYSGSLNLTGGQAFNAVPFDPNKVTVTPAGTATFTFTDGNHGTFAYNVDLGDGVNKGTQSKAISRQVFRDPGTVCH
jgi:plastocyanin